MKNQLSAWVLVISMIIPATGSLLGCSGKIYNNYHCEQQANGVDCDDENPCTQYDSCEMGVCRGEPVRCDDKPCKGRGICQPSGTDAGRCVYQNLEDGASCSDNNACTRRDYCQSGICFGTNPVICLSNSSNPDCDCDPRTGICDASCSRVCDDENACTIDSKDARGVCVHEPIVCRAAKACELRLYCSTQGPNAGQCIPEQKAENEDCEDHDPCTKSSHCKSGECQVKEPFCEDDKTCVPNGTDQPDCYGVPDCDDQDPCTKDYRDSVDGECKHKQFCEESQTCVPNGTDQPDCRGNSKEAFSAEKVKVLEIPDNFDVAMDSDGNSYVVGRVNPGNRKFDEFEVIVQGTTPETPDVIVIKYSSADKKAAWARRIGADNEADNPSMQHPVSVAHANSTLAIIGKFKSGLRLDSIDLENSSQIEKDFIIFLSADDGTGLWGESYNLGQEGKLIAVATDPSGKRIAVCGSAKIAATDLVTGAIYGGGLDLLVAMYDSNGNLLWARQIGGVKDQECNSLAIDGNGDLYAAGKYNGVLDLGLGALSNPNNDFRRWIWVAKMSGVDGSTLANAQFGNTHGFHTPLSLAVDAQGNVLMGGTFNYKLNFAPADASKELISVTAGEADGFVAKLNGSDFSHLWSVRLGGEAIDVIAGVDVTSTNDVVAVGRFRSASTTGAAQFIGAGTVDAFLLKLAAVNGSTLFSQSFGDDKTQNAEKVVVNSQGSSHIDLIEFGGGFDGMMSFPYPAGDVSVINEQAAYLVFVDF